MRLLRVGIIGAGFIGQQHIEAIRRIPGTEVVALADSNAQTAWDKSEQLFIPKSYQDYKEMLSDPDIDVVHNCTPNAMHHSVNCDIIQSGKHVYSEKPLAISTNESKELVDLAMKYQVANAVNFNYRHNSIAQEMRERVKSGDAGRIFMVHGQYLQDWLLYDTDYDWRMDVKMGGPSRAVADIGSHWFDIVQFITGQKIKSVYANLLTVHPIRRRYQKKNGTFSSDVDDTFDEVSITTEDAGFIMVRFENGVQGALTISQVSAGKKNDLRVTIDSSNYSLYWEQENPDKLHIGNRSKPNETLFSSSYFLSGDAKRYATLPTGHPVAWHDAFRNGINEFYNSIRNDTYMNEEQNYATFATGHRIMQLVEACLESNTTSTWVDVE